MNIFTFAVLTLVLCLKFSSGQPINNQGSNDQTAAYNSNGQSTNYNNQKTTVVEQSVESNSSGTTVVTKTNSQPSNTQTNTQPVVTSNGNSSYDKVVVTSTHGRKKRNVQ